MSTTLKTIKIIPIQRSSITMEVKFETNGLIQNEMKMVSLFLRRRYPMKVVFKRGYRLLLYLHNGAWCP